MDDVGILYGHLDYFAAIWYILWYFGIFYGNLVYFMVILVCFSRFCYVVPRKIWQHRGLHLNACAEETYLRLQSKMICDAVCLFKRHRGHAIIETRLHHFLKIATMQFEYVDIN
jgi:hypothetical protein